MILRKIFCCKRKIKKVRKKRHSKLEVKFGGVCGDNI